MSEHSPTAGHEETYGDYGPAGEVAAGYAHEHADPQAAYSDEVAYGDEGPGGYGEDAVYGDEGPAGYQEDVAYGDAGPSGYHEDVAYGDAGPSGPHEDAAHGAPARRKRKGKGKGKGKGKAKAAAKGAKATKGARDPKRRRMLLIGGLGLALMGLLGASGYYMLAMSQGAGQPGFDIGSLMHMLPLGGPKDTDATISTDQDNLATVRAAVEAYTIAHHQLPSTGEAITRQLADMHRTLGNPYQANTPPHLSLGEDPGAPGAIAYAITRRGYELHVGDAAGKALMVSGVPVVLMGRAPESHAPSHLAKTAIAARPAPHPSEATAGETPTPAGKLKITAPPAAPHGAPDTEPDTARVPPAPADRAPGDERSRTTAPPRAAPRAQTPQGHASEATPLPQPTPTLPSVYVGSRSPIVQRNQRFDHWRIEGITLVREQKTKESLDAFKQALAIHPDDATVQRWVGVIQDVIAKHDAEEKAKYEQAKAEMLKSLQTQVPGSQAPSLPPAQQINEVDPTLLPKIPSVKPGAT